MERSISFERTMPVTFDAAARALSARQAEVVLDDPDAGTLELDADVAGFLVSRPVHPTVEAVDRLDKQAVVVPMAWQAAQHPRRFPTFRGILELSALSERPPQSRLALIGTVRPPLGVLGSMGAAAGGAHLEDSVLETLLDRITARLVHVVTGREAAGTAAARSGRRLVPGG